MKRISEYHFYSVLVVIGFLVLYSQLFIVQLVNGRDNRLLAEENRLQKQVIQAPRGQVYDREGNLLAANQPVYRLVSQPEKPLDRIAALVIQEQSDMKVTIESKREYPFGSAVAHVVGYLGLADSDDLNKDRLFSGYRNVTFIGKSGIEQYYENVLKGHDGSRLVEIDTQGKIIREINQLPAIAGNDLVLAIDLRLQQAAGQLMRNKKGAIVATDPRTGEIIALYSSPSFEPRIITEGVNTSKINDYLTNPDMPLFNRVISGRYPPGSTFKLITAVAGLAEEKITPETKYLDTGVVSVGEFSYTNWYWTGYGRTEGEISLTKALARSTDTYFYHLGGLVGVEKLKDWADKFGLTKLSGIDEPGEVNGFIGTPEWKKKNKGEDWFLGNTYHLAIGQGDIGLTPLGVNLMTAVIANQGYICTPRLLKIGAVNTPYQPDCRSIGIDRKITDEIKKGMAMACATGGTGWPFFSFKPTVACKTGTAETGTKDVSHAWFTAFAPIDNPSIVLTVLVENGGEGSSVAGPIAKELLKIWFDINNAKL